MPEESDMSKTKNDEPEEAKAKTTETPATSPTGELDYSASAAVEEKHQKELDRLAEERLYRPPTEAEAPAPEPAATEK
jgi:hypothetical protein